MEKQDAQFNKMTETPIPKLITMLSVPTVISMLVTAIYNTADAYFVAKIGNNSGIRKSDTSKIINNTQVSKPQNHQ